MEETTMSLLDWIYIVGGLVLFAVFVDGLRRMNINRRQRIKLKIELDEKNGVPEERSEVSRLRGELPNGGARIVRTEPFISSDEAEIDDPSDEKPSHDEWLATSSFVEESNLEGNASEVISEMVPDLTNKAANKVFEKGLKISDKTAKETAEKSKEKVTSKIKSVVHKQLDFSDALFASENDQPPKKNAKARQPEKIEDIIVIHIQVRAEKMVSSQQLLPVLKNNGMRYGEMGIFHRQDDRNIASTPLFSLANSREPGTFDMEDSEGFEVSGLTLFFTLPGPDDPVVAIEEMIKLAQILKTELHADWLDSGRNPLNTQILEHLRQKARDFKLQHPA